MPGSPRSGGRRSRRRAVDRRSRRPRRTPRRTTHRRPKSTTRRRPSMPARQNCIECLPPTYWLDTSGALGQPGSGASGNPANDVQAFDNGYNDSLEVTDFQIALPQGAVVRGIEFSVDRMANDGNATDQSVRVPQGSRRHRRRPREQRGLAANVHSGDLRQPDRHVGILVDRRGRGVHVLRHLDHAAVPSVGRQRQRRRRFDDGDGLLRRNARLPLNAGRADGATTDSRCIPSARACRAS